MNDETHTREEIADAARDVQTWQTPPSSRTLAEAVQELADTVRGGGARYDDAPLSCPYCSVGLEYDATCDCDTDPSCVRCHRLHHVENVRRYTA